jgi:hypothetical protein
MNNQQILREMRQNPSQPKNFIRQDAFWAGTFLGSFHLRSIQGREYMRVWPGRFYFLGVTWDGVGINFTLFSENATGLELCLFVYR